MPFTFAHPAIVLPFSKISGRYLSLTGLVIGSLVPDFEYFIRLKVYSEVSHTAAGLLYFNLPVGMLSYLLLISLVRRPLLVHLPAFLRERVDMPLQPPALFVVAYSVVTGAASHLFWDAFTHETGFFVTHTPVLQYYFILPFGPKMVPVYKLLQHGSSAIGLVFICYVIFRQPRRRVTAVAKSRYYWFVVALVMFSLLFAQYFFRSVVTTGDYIVGSISGLFLGLFCASVLLRSSVNIRSD